MTSGQRSLALAGRAFGLDLELGFPVAGLEGGSAEAPGQDGGGSQRTAVELVSAAALDADWPAAGATQVHTSLSPEGRVVASVEQHETAGYRLVSQAHGRFVVRSDGSSVRCAPAPVEAWIWQSFLVGRALPLAATLKGLEVLHASAVDIEGHAVALVGRPGAGKSSLALHLALRGMTFRGDDVLALETHPMGVTAHPGPGVSNLRHDERRSLEASGLAASWDVIGRDDEVSRLAVPRARRGAPLGVIYYLDRRRDVSDVRFEPIAPPDPRLLLASTFVFLVRTPERLTNQLETCARVAAAAALFRLRVPATVGAGELAESLVAHARATLRD